MAAATPTINLPKIYLPTGFERQQAQAAAKQKLADAMMGQGLAPDNNMVSPLQLLGHLAQTWAGKSLGRDALEGQIKTGEDMRAAYTGVQGDFDKDVASGMGVEELFTKYRSNPMMGETLKPYIEAFTANLKRKGELAQPDMNKQVIQGPDGQWHVNPLRVAADRAGAGFGIEGYPQSLPTPDRSGLVGAMMGGQGQELPPVPSAMPVPPQGSNSIPYGNPLDPNIGKIPPPTHMTTDGRPAWFINGQYYDNPEGR